MPTTAAFIYLILFFVLLCLGTPILGRWMASVLNGYPPVVLSWLRPIERALYRLSGLSPTREMNWKEYAMGLACFHVWGFLVLLLLQLGQAHLPFNPTGLPAVPLGIAANTAVSFITNTNWQAYSGESTMSYGVQMGGLGVQNFLSAATGLAVLAAVARGMARSKASGLGNFWADLVRSTLYILLPLSLILAVVLVSQGVVMSFAPYVHAHTLEGTEQVIPLGPAASQIAIKQLGTNGGGFFGVNSAHPLENPTPLSNFLQTLAILLLPAGCVYAYGKLTGALRHAWVVFAVMMFFFASHLAVALWSEYQVHPALGEIAAWEGKEARFGIVPSVLWSQVTTVASNGSVNAMHSSLSPLAGGLAIWNMLLGEVIFGGIGSGMYGMVAMIVLAVFLAGLMVGRTPEYLAKKIGAHEVKMAAVAILLPGICVLLGCALSFLTEAGRGAVGNPGPHAVSEILYAWASMGNNNGSAFGSLTATGPIYTYGGALIMLVGRFGVILPILAMAGAFSTRQKVPPSESTFPVDGGIFAIWLCAVLLIVAGLNFFPALALGPGLEQLLLQSGRLF